MPQSTKNNLHSQESSKINPAHLPAVASLKEIGRLFYEHGWSRGTSSNYSCVLDRDPLRVLITASGKDKRALSTDDFIVIDEGANVISTPQQKPSAETMLHLAAVIHQGAGCVLHTHSVWSTVLSDYFADQNGFFIEGYEMLKGLEGITTHEERYWLDIFPNSQNIAALADQVSARLAAKNQPLQHGYLILRHGLYTWGKDISEARRHVEIFEFLFEVLVRKLSIAGARI